MLIYLSMIDSEEDKSKFEIIYNEYKNLMFYTANQVLGDTRDTEDIVHQAFVKIIEILHQIDDPMCPQTRSLVVIITERKAIDLYRSRKRRTVLSIEEDHINVPMYSEIETFSERSTLAKAIAMLPERYRELILLKYDHGYSEREIADILSMTDANVKKTIQRAKGKLASILEEFDSLV